MEETKKIKITDIGLDEISIAIVKNAADSYLELRKKMRDNPDDKDFKSWESELTSIVRFFYSNWYSMLTKLKPEYLIRLLDETFEEGKTSIAYLRLS